MRASVLGGDSGILSFDQPPFFVVRPRAFSPYFCSFQSPHRWWCSWGSIDMSSCLHSTSDKCIRRSRLRSNRYERWHWALEKICLSVTFFRSNTSWQCRVDARKVLIFLHWFFCNNLLSSFLILFYSLISATNSPFIPPFFNGWKTKKPLHRHDKKRGNTSQFFVSAM